MKRLKYFGISAAATVAILAFAGSASATSVSTTTGGAAATPTIHAVNEGGHVTLANPIANISCSLTSESTVESHGAGMPVSGKFTKFELTGCTNSWHVTVHPIGSGWDIVGTGGYVGITRWVALLITTTRLGVNCVYQANNTTIGTDTGGNPATLRLEATIPINTSESSGLCGTSAAKLEGSLVTTSALYITP